MATSSSESEQVCSDSGNNNTMVVNNMIYCGSQGSSPNISLHADECSQTSESYIGAANPIIGNETSIFSSDSDQIRCRNYLVQLQDGTGASGSGVTVTHFPVSHSSTMNGQSYKDQSQVKRKNSKEKKHSLQDSFRKNSNCANVGKSCNVTSNNHYRQKTASSINRQCISNSNRQHPSNSSSSDKDHSSSKCHRRLSASHNTLPCTNISSNSTRVIRPSSLHIHQSSANKTQQKTNLLSPSQSHSELPNHSSRSRKKSVTHRDISSTRRSLVGQHPTSHLPHQQQPSRSKSANPSTRCHNSSQSRRKSTIETSQSSSSNNSSRLQTEGSKTVHTASSNIQCSASGYESSDSTNSISCKVINKPLNQSSYEHEPSLNHISTSTITLSNPQVNIQDSKLQSNSHTESSSTIYPYEIAEGAQATAGSSIDISTCLQSDIPLPGSSSSSSLPDTLQLGSWGNIDPQCLTRVSPTTPPRAPTPPRSTVSPHPHRRSVSPNLQRRSVSPHLHNQPVSPHLPNSRRSMSPPPLPHNALGQPPSPTLRQRLSPRPRCARTPSPRPPLPPSSAPVEQSPPPHRAPASPHAHLNKMRGR